MTKVICPDCEMETDHIVNSTGTCKLCYRRFQNMKSRGQEYTTLKSLKGTKEYNRAMGRRLTTIARNQEKSEKVTPKKTKEVKVKKPKETNKNHLEGYDLIDVNANKLLECIDYLKLCLDSIPKMEEQVTKMQEEMLLITHQKLETNGPGDKEFDKLNAREYDIIVYRRQIKDILVYLRNINPEILNDDLIQDLDNTQRRYERDAYIPKYARGDVQEYDVKVNVNGLHGSTQVQSFQRHVYAKNEIEAKAYVENFLKGLNGVIIHGKTWKIIQLGGNTNG